MSRNGMINYLINMKKLSILAIYFILVLFSCSSKSDNSSSRDNNSTDNNSYNSSDEENDEENYEENDEESNEEYSDGCKFEDGTYSATVDYYNPETNYSNTYTLDVEVEDCQVVQINFPNDGYLDEDHISAADLDENGNASVDGENGKTYEIQIDY